MESPSPWKTAVAAALCTVGIFLSLPLVDLVSRKGSNRIRVLPVDSLRVPALQPPAPARPPARRERPVVASPLPRLAPRIHQLPLRALLDVPSSVGGGGGQFAAGFALSDNSAPDLDNPVFALNELDQAPVPILRLEPMYPARARAERIEGEVELEFVVSADGNVVQAEVVSSRPGNLFDAAAVRAVVGWTFQPGVREGRPVAVRVRQKVRFNLQ